MSRTSHMSALRSIPAVVRQVLALVSVCLFSACAHDPIGIYRFQTELESQPTAFRNGSAGEPLAVTIRLQNQSDQAVKIGASDPTSDGLRLSAHIDGGPGFLGQPVVQVGYRGGETVRAGSDPNSQLFGDKHAGAVAKLADVGGPLLHLSADNVHSYLDLLANEAGYVAVIPVDWSQVPTRDAQGADLRFVRVEFNLSIDIGYIGEKLHRFAFQGSLQRHIVAYLDNGARYPSGTLPTPNGPIQGAFQPVP